MHPAPSIIAFTALSGLGFGLMVFLGLMPGDKAPWVMGTFCLLALALASLGLMSSLFHLGHPERFIKALSQWRSSWLSREGVLAILTLAVFALYGALWVLTGAQLAPLGWLAALLALGTVYCTAMIYAQMKPVPRWHSPLTPGLFLAFSLAGGALLAGEITPALWAFAVLAALQAAAWRKGDLAFAQSGTTMNTATGLTKGEVRLLEAPHTGPNYLMKEMVFQIGRKHTRILRIAGLTLAAVLPLVAILLFEVKHTLAGLLVLSHVAGLFITRWLFFAEAEHVVGLYYGKR
ncbi:MAG: DmsC/YnfH family molybdoenzyme membrane anchor subunit [Pseudomonadota bacterium]